MDRIRTRLLDLTNRNKLLNFRHSNSSSLRVVDVGINDVFARLRDGEKLALSAVPEPDGDGEEKPTAKDHAHELGWSTSTLLGDITTFRKVFCAEDDRTLVPGQEHELQRRLAIVLQRTLRRQAQEFLDRPFTQRRCRLYEYAMSDDERSLYDDVTEYLLQPSLYAFAGRQRRLLLIGFHRRMASSIPALASSLEKVAARLRRLQSGLQLRRNGDGHVSRS